MATQKPNQNPNSAKAHHLLPANGMPLRTVFKNTPCSPDASLGLINEVLTEKLEF